MELLSPISVASSPDLSSAGVGARQESVLVVASDPKRRQELVDIIEGAGWLPLAADNAEGALHLFRMAPPDLVLLAFDGTDLAELEVLDLLRAEPDGGRTPIVCNLPRRNRALFVEAFGRRADDVVVGRPVAVELVARLRIRMLRRAQAHNEIQLDPVTGALVPAAFADQTRRELERVFRGGRPGIFAYLAVDELPGIEGDLGSRARDEIVAQVIDLVDEDSRTLDFVGFSRGVVGLLMPSTPVKGAQIRLDRLSKLIFEHDFVLRGETVRLTPIIGFTKTDGELTLEDVEDQAWDAMAYEAEQRDLHPTLWEQAMSGGPSTKSRLVRAFHKVRTPIQVTAQQAILFGLPFVFYLSMDYAGLDFTGPIYLLLVAALFLTSITIIAESRAAHDPPEPPPLPDEDGAERPLASAIIAAYLPNEAETIVETIESFLKQDYPNLQVILAYNSPRRMNVESELAAIARRDPRFEPLRVEGSVSKAQNVNAALSHVRGEFLGLFDADHQPEPGSFERAWRWIASGVGVVQGHCVIRNGGDNRVTRLIAAEFEVIYAVSHPGRAKLHDFGIFGGSNGYWRTSLLKKTRMRGFMLTEDIDSSIRIVGEGETIISDPSLISTELAPDTVSALWNQRMRWAQGWSQVSLRHLMRMVRTSATTRRRLGFAHLLGWREIYPWISLQMFPLFAFWWVQGRTDTDWFIPIFVFTSIVTFSAGPLQVWSAWKLAHPSIAQHKRWFVMFFFSSMFFYTEWKNVIARTAHLKEAMREREWKVTPRSSKPSAASTDLSELPEEVAAKITVDPTEPVPRSGLRYEQVEAEEAAEYARRSSAHARRAEDPAPVVADEPGDSQVPGAGTPRPRSASQ